MTGYSVDTFNLFPVPVGVRSRVHSSVVRLKVRGEPPVAYGNAPRVRHVGIGR